MSVSIRLSAYLILPLLLSVSSFATMNFLGERFADDLLVQGIMLSISLLLGLLPILLYHFFVHSQLQQGFAHMDNGSVLLPNELGLAAVVGDRVVHWQSFEQTLNTTVRLHGTKADLRVSISVILTLWPDRHGKKLARHLDEAIPLLERSIQECLYSASCMDDGFSLALDGSTLLNEDDERVLKSKFLSALEMLEIKGVFFPHDASGIHIDRNVKKEKPAPEAPAAKDDILDEDLLLDDDLLKSAGMA